MSLTRSNLETVHRHRQRRVEEIRDEYVAMIHLLRDQEAQFERAQELLAHTIREFARRQADDMHSSEIDAYYRFVAHQAAEIKDRQEALDRFRTECETKRSVLAHAEQDEQLIAGIEHSRRETARRP
ncbi:MAG: hypothetical protein HY207_02625 [Nitrospirae bacterium]|nr:hypothetical protein [Nitrospirota bacterium]